MKQITFLSLFLCFLFSYGQKSQQIHQHQHKYVENEPTNCIAAPSSLVITQPDQTQLTVVGKGNMVNSRTETTDGYTLVKNANGIYEYATLKNGILQASGVKANDLLKRGLSETAYVSNLKTSVQATPNPLKTSILNQVRKQILNKSFPTTGNIRVLALLIDFPDLGHTYTNADFDSLLNGLNYNNGKGSFKTFYNDASNGQLNITVDLMGWIQVDSSYIYYGRDSGSARAADLVREAVDSAELRGVNFANYDNDNDGSVDGIMAIHAGQGAEVGNQTQYIWSHRWVLNGGTKGAVQYDGVWINDYMINPEIYRFGAISGIGVFCHEFGHNLGLPDLYDTDDSNGKSEGIGNWGIMAGGTWLGGGQQPGNFSAWSRIEYGWETPTILTIGTSNGPYSLNPANNKDEIYRINTSVSSEYFLLENRQQLGVDTALPGTGLAIWHINTLKTNSFGNGVNADETLKGVDLEEADGNDDLDRSVNRGDAGDLFPGTSVNRMFNDTTSPNARNYSSAATGIIIRNIQENNQIITFGFGPKSAGICGNDTLRKSSDTLSDRSGKTNVYANNLSCTWLIQPTIPAQSITLSFNSFKTQAIHDSVSVYDGADNTASLLGSYSGNNLPSNVTSTGGALFIEFHTNATVTDSGWTATYTASNLKDSIEIIQDTLYLNVNLMSNASFTLNSNTDWDITNNASWMTVSPMSGNKDTSLSCTVTQANTGLERSIMIYGITKNNKAIDSLLVIQRGIIPQLIVRPTTINLNFMASSHDSIRVQSNLAWSVANPKSWLSLSNNSGSNNEVFALTANSANMSGSVRSDTLTFSANGVSDQYVYVNQADGSQPTFTVSTDTVYLDSSQGSKGSFRVLANAANWTLTESSPWLLINPTSGTQTTTINLSSSSKNVYGNPRYANIKASDPVLGDTTVVVVQRASAPLFKISQSTIHLKSTQGDYKTFNVSSNLEYWMVSENTTWMKVTPLSGSFTREITVTATEDNNTKIMRTGVVTVSAPPLVSKTVLVSQDTLRAVGIIENDLEEHVVVYPNPSHGIVNIEMDNAFDFSSLKLKVYNSVGVEVPLQMKIESSRIVSFNFSQLATGFYFLTIDYDGSRLSKKISILGN